MELSTNRSELIIAIDGYSSCGKSTFAKAIAARLGYIFIDTGAMYRAVTLAALRGGLLDSEMIDSEEVEKMLEGVEISFKFNEARGASDIYLCGESVEQQIRTMEVSDRVSKVSALAAVRAKLVALQQEMGRRGGVVMDGRDIGTVVFPDAEIKIFMQADPVVRGRRRYLELKAKGDESVTLEQIVESVRRRDRDDETREISPLRRAEDALTLDNSEMGVEEQMVWFDELYNRVKR
ncbi:MAG: (d)CMP kinase [Rikenellaceae bacterium]